MPRKKRVTINPTEQNITVATLLPIGIVEHLEHIARKRLSTKSQYLREAVIARLQAEDEVEHEAEEIEA